jgi:hypothetical protein
MPETCSFLTKSNLGELRLVGLLKRNFVTMHGNMNVKKNKRNGRTDCTEYCSKNNIGCLWTSLGVLSDICLE